MLLAAGAGAGQEPVRVDALLEPLLAEHSMPAVGGALVRGGRVVALGVAGVRAAGSDAKVTIDDLWHLGSCTKAMTATLVGRLVDRGALRFDATLGELLADEPELELAEGWRAVTVADLLTNRGGLPTDLGRDGLWGRLRRREGTPREQRTQLLLGLLASPPEHPRGEFLYSNAGFALAGALAERVDGRDFEQLLRAELLEPLGARGMGFGAPGTKDRLDQPRGHRTVLGRLVPLDPGPQADNPPAIAPAGTVHASLGDWARFVALHLAAARGEARLLEHETFATLHRPVGSYAMGWGVGERGWAGGRVLTHSGSNTHWFAVVWIAPERDLALLAVTNRGGDEGSQGCDAAVQALLRWAQDRPDGEPRAGGDGRAQR